MTLSLDDVRNKRFRMARKSGYEVLEVDEFVDEVEESFAQLIEENQNLKKQVEALRGAPASATAQPVASAPAADTSPAPTAPAPQGQPAAKPDVTAAPQAPADVIVVTTGKEASTAVIRLVEMATDQAERLVEEATADATRIRDEAARGADQVTSEAAKKAERLTADAHSRAEQLDRDIESRRTELFSDLEKRRDELTHTVEALRGFEAAYRSNLTSHLRSQIESLESGKAEPAEVPEILRHRPAGGPAPTAGPTEAQAEKDNSPAATTSNTPRLDALLGDQH